MRSSTIEVLPGVHAQTALKIRVKPRVELLASLSISNQGTLYVNPTMKGAENGITFGEYPIEPIDRETLAFFGVKAPRKSGTYLVYTRDSHDMVLIVGTNRELYRAVGAPVALRDVY